MSFLKISRDKKVFDLLSCVFACKICIDSISRRSNMKRAFSTIKFIKNDLRNWMGDEFMNNCMVIYIERDVFRGIPNDVIMDRFQKMKTRRRQLY